MAGKTKKSTRKSKKIKKITKKKNIKKTKKQKITKNMKFSEVLNKYPQSAEIMANYGLHCIGCQVAAFETIEQGAKAHGMTKTQLNKMLNDLNKNIKEKPKVETPKIKEKPIESIIQKPKKKSFFRKLFGG